MTKNIGLRGVTVADTKVSFVDGEHGRLLYRGYAIADLAAKSTFEEVVFLLLHGRLPRAPELALFAAELGAVRPLPEQLLAYLEVRSRTADPMDVLQGAMSLLADHDPDVRNTARDARVRSSIRLIARTAMIVAAWYHVRQGRRPTVMRDKPGHAEAFLETLWGRHPSTGETQLMNTLLVLHAEHTFNASTFAVREVASTKAHLYASIAAGVGALSGPLHGAANARVMEMLEKIDSVDNVVPWLTARINAGQRVMGLGHAVYKTEDPRAHVLRHIAEDVLAGRAEEKWFRLALVVEKESRRLLKEIKGIDLHPNVDFYSGGVLRALGLPNEFFPAFFAVSRVAGWCAHYIEEEFAEAQPKPELYRPESNYVGRFCGDQGCQFVPLEARGAGCPCGEDFEGCNEEQSL